MEEIARLEVTLSVLLAGTRARIARVRHGDAPEQLTVEDAAGEPPHRFVRIGATHHVTIGARFSLMCTSYDGRGHTDDWRRLDTFDSVLRFIDAWFVQRQPWHDADVSTRAPVYQLA